MISDWIFHHDSLAAVGTGTNPPSNQPKGEMEHQQEYTLEPIEYSMPLHPHGGAAPPPGGPGPQRSQRNGPGHATGWQPGQELLPPGGVSQYPAPPHVMMYHPQPWPANQEGGAANQPQHTEVRTTARKREAGG